MSHKLVTPFYVVCIPFILLPYFYDALQCQSMALCVDKLSLWFLLHAGFLLHPVMLRMRVKTRGKVFLNNFEDLIVNDCAARRLKTAFFCACVHNLFSYLHTMIFLSHLAQNPVQSVRINPQWSNKKNGRFCLFFSYTQTEVFFQLV